MNARTLFPNWPAPDAVLHIGAGTGEELPVYLALGIADIVLVEPDPECLVALHRRVHEVPGVRLIPAALAEGSAHVVLHQFNHPMLNGLVEPLGYEQVLPGLRKLGTRQVPVITPVELLRATGFSGNTDNWLVIDCPGLPPGLVNGLLSDESIRFSRIIARHVPVRRGEPERLERWLEPFADFGYRVALGHPSAGSLWPCCHLLPGAEDRPQSPAAERLQGRVDIPGDLSLLGDDDWLRKAVSVLERQGRLMDALLDREQRSG